MRKSLLLPVLFLALTFPAAAVCQVMPGPGYMVWQQGINNGSGKVCGKPYSSDAEKEQLLALEAAGKCATNQATSNKLPPGWTQKETPNATMYSYGNNNAVVIFGRADLAKTPTPAAIAQTLDKPGVCTGITTAPVTPVLRGRAQMMQIQNAAMRCTVLTGADTNTAYSVVAMEQPAAGANAAAFAQSLLVRAMGPTPAEAPRTSAVAAMGASDALRRALASVPIASRPIAMPTRREASNSGGLNYIVHRPWMVFANGYATDSRCYDWDPRQLAPTPQSLGAAGRQCDIVKWRKAGGAYQFQEKDGTWDSDAHGAVLYPFATGLKLDRTLENAGGAGSAPVTGMLSVNTVFNGGLKMTASGYIQSDWSNTTGISGAGIGGGASGSGINLAGRYYADGYLIAVSDARGTIKIGFIAGSHDKGERRYTHIYLNGTQYWPGDK